MAGGKESGTAEGKMHLSEYLEAVAELLDYHRNSGIECYPRNDGVDRFLNTVDSKKLRAVSQGYGDASAVNQSRMSTTSMWKGELAEVKASPEFLEAIAEDIAICRACSLHEQRAGYRVGSGNSNVRLMLVGDWLRCPRELSLPGSTQFGVEEDRMVSRMLEAIRLEMDKVCVTNTIKCAVPDGCQPTSENIRTCVSYLYRQIALIEPEIICGMGLVAAQALLGSAQPLSRLRGSIHSFTAGTGKQLPIIVTYHPTFLLQNPTMKKAAWTDLQSIGRYLKTF
jgi:DNA polymerase